MDFLLRFSEYKQLVLYFVTHITIKRILFERIGFYIILFHCHPNTHNFQKRGESLREKSLKNNSYFSLFSYKTYSLYLPLRFVIFIVRNALQWDYG